MSKTGDTIVLAIGALGLLGMGVLCTMTGMDSGTTKDISEPVIKPVTKPDTKQYSYGDAIAAIAKSDMDAFYKAQATKYVSTDGTSDIYQGIVGIAEASGTDSFYRYESIKAICEK